MTYHFLSITQMTTKAAAGFALFALALLTCSCADSVDSSGFEQGGPGITIPGNSIEGIQLGDSRERVEELLGVNRDVGLADGPYRALEERCPISAGGARKVPASFGCGMARCDPPPSPRRADVYVLGLLARRLRPRRRHPDRPFAAE